MTDIRLSQHFMLSEFIKSNTAVRLGIRNEPNQTQINALRLLCEKVLEPVRTEAGAPVVISSGFRSLLLNKAVGGASTSQHLKGEAADFEVPGASNYEVAKWMEKKLNYDQLILEFYKSGNENSGWIHVSYREPYRNEELTFDGKRYMKGLIR